MTSNNLGDNWHSLRKTIIYPAELPDDMWGIEDSTILYLPSDIGPVIISYDDPGCSGKFVINPGY